jgi:hypothetical protein
MTSQSVDELAALRKKYYALDAERKTAYQRMEQLRKTNKDTI